MTERNTNTSLITHRISELLKEMYKKPWGAQTAFANLIGETPTRVHGWIKGGHAPNSEICAKIAEKTGCSLNWLLSGVGDMFEQWERVAEDSQRANLPLYNNIPSGPPESVGDTGEVRQVFAEIASCDRYLLNVQTDVMRPELRRGDKIVVEYQNGGDLRLYDNKICAVNFNGNRVITRVQVHGERGKEIIMLKYDAEPAPWETFVVGTKAFEVVGVFKGLIRVEPANGAAKG